MQRVFRAGAVVVFLCALTSVVGHSASAGGLQPDPTKKSFPYLDEIRFGVLIQDIEESNANSGGDFNLEVLFGRISQPRGDYLLDLFLTPRLHLGANIDFDGETNQAYFGFTWDIRLNDWLFFETSFGGAVHDGDTGKNDEVSFGCSINFRESAAIGVELSERLRVQVGVDHMSNAGLCDRNDGLTNGGIRFGYRW